MENGEMFGKTDIKRWLREVMIVLLTMTALAIAVNAWRPDGLQLFSEEWQAQSLSTSPLSIPAISIEKAVEEYERGRALLIDARPVEDYVKGHIKGALSLPDGHFDETFSKVVEQLEKFEVLIAYCDGESCPLGHALAEKLHELGFHNVFYLVNGWSLWREKGLPVSSGSQGLR